jgi:excisionase family DNA binding protein
MILLTAKDVAERLRVKEKTVYAWASQGKIPTVRINGLRRFDGSEIDAWLESCRQAALPSRLVPKVNPPGRIKTDVDSLVERAKRAVYTTCGETRPIASPKRKEAGDGAR